MWHKRNETDGTVCGLDERFCEDKKLKQWTNDLSNWPVCFIEYLKFLKVFILIGLLFNRFATSLMCLYRVHLIMII